MLDIFSIIDSMKNNFPLLKIKVIQTTFLVPESLNWWVLTVNNDWKYKLIVTIVRSSTLNIDAYIENVLYIKIFTLIYKFLSFKEFHIKFAVLLIL